MKDLIDIKLKKPIRSYTGEKWKTNATNKKYLAKDFNDRCAYCDDYHGFTGGYNTYHVEHFAPKEKFPELQFKYENLLYSCAYCNISKSNKWVSDDSSVNVVGNCGFLDPCDKEYYKHLKRKKTGEIIYRSEIGKYIYYELKLYLKRHEVLFNLDRIRTKRNALKKKIDEKESRGESVRKLESLYKDLSVVFCEYYELLMNEN